MTLAYQIVAEMEVAEVSLMLALAPVYMIIRLPDDIPIDGDYGLPLFNNEAE